MMLWARQAGRAGCAAASCIRSSCCSLDAQAAGSLPLEVCHLRRMAFTARKLRATFPAHLACEQRRGFGTTGPEPSDDSGKDKDPHQRQIDRAKKVYNSDGVDALVLLTLPSRHLVWTVALEVLRLKFPAVWNRSEFYDGVEFAIHKIYECLAKGDADSLAGLVSDALRVRLRKDVATQSSERWASAPDLQQVQVLGVLWATTFGDLHGQGPGLQVELAIAMREMYIYENAEQPIISRRLARWTLERSIDDHGHWMVTQMSRNPVPWYYTEDEPE